MNHLVAKNGEEAMANLVDDLGGTATVQAWDPLMAAHWAIAGRVLDAAGLGAMGQCPLCIVQDSYDVWDTPEAPSPRPEEAADAQEWIDGCMDAMLAYAHEQGLMEPGKPKADATP